MSSLATATEAERGFLWGLSYRLTGSSADADDVVQEVFVRALETKPDVSRPLRPWLAQVATRLCLDRLRARQTAVRKGVWLPALVDTPEAWLDSAVVTQASPEVTYDLRESVTMAFLLALEVLSPEQRAVLVLRDVFDWSAADVAHTLALEEANVRQLHHRARVALEGYDRQRCRPDAELRARSRVMLEQLLAALLEGDAGAAAKVLRQDVKALSDGGGKYLAANVVLTGIQRVYEFYRRLSELRPITDLRFVLRNGLWVVELDMVPHHDREAPRSVTGLIIDSEHPDASVLFTQLADDKLGGGSLVA